jgi:uncharacterized protein YlxW (UPF0749 family)
MKHQQPQHKKFSQWWRNIRSLTPELRNTTLMRWLNYATRTAGLCHTSDVQQVIYTIRDRYVNSKYKRITRANAFRVYNLVNQHQQNYKRLKQERDLLVERTKQLSEKSTSTLSGPVIRTRKSRKIISGGSAGAV